MFYYTTIKTIPQLDTSNGTNFSEMFSMSENLESLPELDLSNAETCTMMFDDCYSLKYLGGFKGLKVDLVLYYSLQLTHESLMNVINNLAEVDTNPTLSLGSKNLAKLTDAEKAIAINKGWILE
jgi:hypothetical protein